MQTPRIAVVGSANIDLVTFTDKFPKPGQTIFGDRFDLGFGGKGANQAVAARLCGAQVDMVAKVGEDLFGPATIRNLQSYGIDTTHVRIEHGADFTTNDGAHMGLAIVKWIAGTHGGRLSHRHADGANAFSLELKPSKSS